MSRFLISAIVFSTFVSAANAACNTYGTITTCDDGTTYTKVGNTTIGSNSKTGSTWSQTQIGNTTYGTDKDGNSWYHTKTDSGGYGMDSDGDFFNYLD